MKEKNIISQLITGLDSATASDVGVRSAGGDVDIDPPEIIISWSSQRLTEYNGAKNRGGYDLDGDGNKLGNEYHQYYQAEPDFLVRTEKEETLHDLANTIQDRFSPYESDSSLFDGDTAEWEVGELGPRDNPVFEPDWYQAGLVVRFTFVRKTTDSQDTLDTIQKDTEISTSLDDGEITIN